MVKVSDANFEFQKVIAVVGVSLLALKFFAYYLTGFPMDLVHAFATAFFLIVIAEPMLEKLDRIKTKYGLVE